MRGPPGRFLKDAQLPMLTFGEAFDTSCPVQHDGALHRVWFSWLQYLVLSAHSALSSGPTPYQGSHRVKQILYFYHRVVVGMGAQGLFILGFSLSVEVIHILMIQRQTNLFHIRLLELVKGFLVCLGSRIKSSLQSSFTFPLPSDRWL